MKSYQRLGKEVLTENQKENIERLKMLSDGIFAIAMTLLILDLKIPNGLNSAAFHHALIELTVNIGYYFLTFLILASYWRIHRDLMGSMKRVDANFTMLNIILLALVALFPVAQSLRAAYPDQIPAIIIYVAGLASCGGAVRVMWLYAVWKGLLIDKEIEQKYGVVEAVRLLGFPLYILLALGLLPFLANPSYMFIAWIGWPALQFLLRSIQRRHKA